MLLPRSLLAGVAAVATVILAAGNRALDRPQRPGPSGTLIVSNMNDSSATVIDAATGRVRATLPTGRGPHEVAASHDGRWAVVTNYGVRGSPGRTLTMIDVIHATVARTIDLGTYRRPHGARFLPGDTLLAVTSEASQAVLLVDLRSDKVVATLPTKGRVSHMLATTSSGDRFFTTNIADGSISVIDPRAPDAARTIPVAHVTEGLATTPDGGRVWVGSNQDSVVVVVDPSGGAPPDTVRGSGLPYRIAITPNARLAVVTDPVRAEVRVFDTATRTQRFVIEVSRDSVVGTAEVAGSPSPEGVAVSDDSRWAFVTLQGRNRVAWIDLERGTIVRMAPTGAWSDGIAFSVGRER